MYIKLLKINFVFLIFISCGITPENSLVREIKYIDQWERVIDRHIEGKKIIEDVTIEGYLKDVDGNNGIGRYKYSVYYSTGTNMLSKIINTEITDIEVTETFYFAVNADLMLATAVLPNVSHKIYILDGEIISASETSKEEHQVLLNKAKAFQQIYKIKPKDEKQFN